MLSTVTITGYVTLRLQDSSGALLKRMHVPNLVVTAGRNVIADRMKATPTKAAMTHMAVGTTGTTALAADTALAAEVGSSRTLLTSTGVTGNQLTYICTFGAGVGTGALVEAGIFNNSSGGDMLCRTTFATLTKAAGDTLTVTWLVTIA